MQSQGEHSDTDPIGTCQIRQKGIGNCWIPCRRFPMGFYRMSEIMGILWILRESNEFRRPTKSDRIPATRIRRFLTKSHKIQWNPMMFPMGTHKIYKSDCLSWVIIDLVQKHMVDHILTLNRQNIQVNIFCEWSMCLSANMVCLRSKRRQNPPIGRFWGGGHSSFCKAILAAIGHGTLRRGLLFRRNFSYLFRNSIRLFLLKSKKDESLRGKIKIWWLVGRSYDKSFSAIKSTINQWGIHVARRSSLYSYIEESGISRTLSLTLKKSHHPACLMFEYV